MRHRLACTLPVSKKTVKLKMPAPCPRRYWHVFLLRPLSSIWLITLHRRSYSTRLARLACGQSMGCRCFCTREHWPLRCGQVSRRRLGSCGQRCSNLFALIVKEALREICQLFYCCHSQTTSGSCPGKRSSRR